MKTQIEELKNDVGILNLENEKLLKQLELNERRGGAGPDRETAKKLKKRELECNALWDTLRDMHVAQRGVFDATQMLDLLSLRALDTKAKRKLKV